MRLLAILGYGYIFLILILLLALGIVVSLAIIFDLIHHHRLYIGMIKLAILLLAPALVILQALSIRIPIPHGLELTRQQTPQLFSLLDKIRKTLQSPPFHRVILNTEFNAGVMQVPRLGLLGWQQNYLLLGLPLLQALSPMEFQAVLCHELGHLSGNHGRFAGWIYRVRKTWEQILVRLNQSDYAGAGILFNRFFNWYTPFFNAYTFVLARANEYEADRCAAELVGNQETARALVSSRVKTQFLDQNFWNKIYKQADNLPDPPANIFSTLEQVLKTEIEPEIMQKWLDDALAIKTSNADTHPCLADRLKALGCDRITANTTTLKITAAQKFLGKELANITTQLSKDWQTAVNYQWKERYN